MLDLIRGLVRPFISVSLICMLAYLVYFGQIESKDILYLTGIVVAFHFGERAALKKPEENGGINEPTN